MLIEIELGKYYKNLVSGHKYHILTYIKTKTFGMTLLAEVFNYTETKVSIIPIKKENFDNNISDYKEITEKEF